MFVWKILYVFILTVNYSIKGVLNSEKFAVQLLQSLKLKYTIQVEGSESIKDVLATYSNYSAIKIDHQNIPVLQENFITDLDLSVIFLRSDEIAEIKLGAFKRLPKLNVLEVTHNKLTELKEGIFDELVYLSILELDYNEIETIHANVFNNLPRLSVLGLSNNKIATYNPQWCQRNPLVIYLSVSGNLIEHIPRRSFGWNNSTVIHKHLYLAYNKIQTIDHNAFEGAGNITLNLHQNEIETLDENWLGDTYVDELDLRDNKIKCLSGDLNKILTPKVIYISGNPWQETCLRTVLQWLEENRGVASNIASIE